MNAQERQRFQDVKVRALELSDRLESESRHWALIFNEAEPLTHDAVVERVTTMQNKLYRLEHPATLPKEEVSQ